MLISVSGSPSAAVRVIHALNLSDKLGLWSDFISVHSIS